ncbi:MAG: exodeoxyribonuclease VII large subunit [Oscillospiraceae bacterium]|nr:exodeoxyribonuclease VII large subunit [Oscillospiraceae bacterium]
MSAILTVSQLNRYIAFKLKEDGNLHGKLIRGEISNFTNHAKSGHFYFTLKDGESSVKAIMFNNMASRLPFMPKNGMRVIVSADVRVYERDGLYQLYVTDMQPDGVGALYLALEQLKERLSQEGIFDESRKKPLPSLPKKIGIVTSADAAALQDMLNILSRRYPIAEVIVFPAAVQGADAPESICSAIHHADKRGMDLLICGRGGGSFEDLSAFNTEAVARCLHGCSTPVISAVGHETDFTVADMAADLRAPTPSAAAELAVPDITLLYGRLNALEKALTNGFLNRLEEKYRILENTARRLESLNPRERAVRLREKFSQSKKRLEAAYNLKLRICGGQLAEKAAVLDGLSPLKTLSRGYSLVYKGERLVNSAEDLSEGDKVDIRLSDGTVSAVIS